MIKYETRWGSYTDIKEIEVERETDSSIWVNGRRTNKRGQYTNCFDTWVDARDYNLKKARMELDGAKYRYDQAQVNYKNVAELKEPE